uniref:Uncharacterized protein n=1 Tax=Timema monikensis TaxID=170555 RepID=A0A7R9HUD6_9NEOP|nr:unnamed protein product [Timema monikensis]
MKASVLLFVVACVFLLEGTQGEDYPDPVALTNNANEEDLTNILKCFYSEGECPKGTVELKAELYVKDTDEKYYHREWVECSMSRPPSKKIWTEEDESEEKSKELESAPSSSESCPDGSASKAQAEAPRSTSTVEQSPNAIVFDTSLINERDPCHDAVRAKKHGSEHMVTVLESFRSHSFFDKLWHHCTQLTEKCGFKPPKLPRRGTPILTSCGSIPAVFLFGRKTFLEILTSVLYESSTLKIMTDFGVLSRMIMNPLHTAKRKFHWLAIFPTVAVSACSNCNPTQKQWFRIVGRHLLANRPADIKKLRETFDPSEEHKEEFLKFITSDD